MIIVPLGLSGQIDNCGANGELQVDLEIETQTRSQSGRSSSNAPPKVNLWPATVVHAVVLQRRPASCCKVVHAAGCCSEICNKDRGEGEGSCYAAARLQVVSARLQV